MDFLGRIDHQVKLRGFRIELGEIETVLGSHPAVRECLVAVRNDTLVAWLTLHETAPADLPAALTAWLQGKLPASMVPAAFVPLDAFPLSPNGKIDRKALPDPSRAAGPEHLGPRDTLELELVRIWEEVLRLHPIGVRDDFFALGGHSLLAVQVTARIESRLGRSLPLAALLRHPTIERLAAHLRDGATAHPRTPLVELAPGTGTPLFLVHPIGGEVLAYVPLARRLGRPVYGLQSTDQALTLEDMAALYLRHVREVQPQGPYRLGGWSLGGAVAYEMARQLEAQGETVEKVFLIDSYAPGPHWPQDLDDRTLVEMFANDLAQLLGIQGVALPASLGSADEALAWLATRAEEAGLLPPGHGAPELQRRFATFAANHRAMAGYTGGPCAAPLVMVRASESSGEADGGWGRLAGREIEVREIEGDHYTLLQEPAVEILAAAL
jgi:thioesterase domain-containing protein